MQSRSLKAVSSWTIDLTIRGSHNVAMVHVVESKGTMSGNELVGLSGSPSRVVTAESSGFLVVEFWQSYLFDI